MRIGCESAVEELALEAVPIQGVLRWLGLFVLFEHIICKHAVETTLMQGFVNGLTVGYQIPCCTHFVFSALTRSRRPSEQVVGEHAVGTALAQGVLGSLTVESAHSTRSALTRSLSAI